MTNPTNLHLKFLAICEYYDVVATSSDLDTVMMQSALARTSEFLCQFKAYISLQIQVLDERLQMQRCCNDMSLDERVRLHFLSDQMAFIKQWRKSFEDIVYQSDATCLINLSSREILYLIRLIRDAELLEKQDLKYTFRFLSRHFYTAQQDKLSAESLRKKYSQFDSKLITSTGVILKRLVDINKSYLRAANDGSD